MKSIVEEASTITKAIEKAWQRAGKPDHFSIKIYQEPTHNLLGFVKNPAKIGLFFDEQTHKERVEKEQPKKAPAKVVRKPVPTQQQPRPAQQTRPQTPVREPHVAVKEPIAKQEPITKQEPSQPKPARQRDIWSDDMVEVAKGWINEVCSLMGLPRHEYTASVAGNNLKILFVAPLIDDIKKERMLFSSFAHLIMQVVRNKSKKRFRNLKVVLTSS